MGLTFLNLVLSAPFYYEFGFAYPDVYEEVVPLECSNTEIKCEIDNKCLQFSDFCNDIQDCSDNIDEKDCTVEENSEQDVLFTDVVQLVQVSTAQPVETTYYIVHYE